MKDPDRLKASPHVLIVDDQSVICMTLAWIFRGKGYETRTAGSAEDALALLEAWIPHIAILDVSLPGMDGVDLAIHLKVLCPDCRLLLISGQPDSIESLKRAQDNGHTLELLPKPVSPTFLLDRAAEMLG
jgi:CheY-like chemotaxis protein